MIKKLQPRLKILYVAKHGSGGNDDEGTITHSLTDLGCEVRCLREGDPLLRSLVSRQMQLPAATRPDVLLFHKWFDPELLGRVSVPKAFWYFDLVRYPDQELESRNLNRVEWMREIMPLVDVGFCTDGDWVLSNPGANLVRLTQGADVRFAAVPPSDGFYENQILFTGISGGGGKGRESFVAYMHHKFGSRFHHVRYGFYQHELQNLIMRSKVVIAPDHPITDNYWSNRVYLMLGFGAFLLHPRCDTLLPQYQDQKEIVYYHTRLDLCDKINRYLLLDDERREIALNGYRRTMQEHTYTHRCRTLIHELVKRGLVPEGVETWQK